jgi:hypothetical protein
MIRVVKVSRYTEHYGIARWGSRDEVDLKRLRMGSCMLMRRRCSFVAQGTFHLASPTVRVLGLRHQQYFGLILQYSESRPVTTGSTLDGILTTYIA